MPLRRRNRLLLPAATFLIALGAPTLAPTAASGEAEGSEQRALREIAEVMRLAHERYGREVPYRDLAYASIQGMLRSFDPHTTFLSAEAYENMRQRQAASFYGLGILVSKRNGRVTVIAPLDGTPASRLGMRSGDVIQAIEGEPTDGMSLDEAVARLKGPKDTEVEITIVRPGLPKPFDLVVPRAEIPQDTVRYAYMMTPEIGYVRLTDFGRSTTREMVDALARLRREGMKKLLLDLRSNGGGLLDQAVAVSDLFLAAGSTIVETRGRVKWSEQTFVDDDDDPDPELALPLVVLVNTGTASAAEILTGAIQDHDVGLVVGTRTWGKGLVQTVYNLSYGNGIALTTARYHTPSGRVIQRDYTSFYDYYGPRVAEAGPAGGAERQVFVTDLGRTVHGGGGITPDVVVELPDLPVALQPLYARNAFFNFAVDYHRRTPVADEAWRPGPGLLDEFSAWLDERRLADESTAAALADEETRADVERQIHSDLFTVALGTEAAHRVLAGGDLQIQKGLELFDQAAELLARRAAAAAD